MPRKRVTPEPTYDIVVVQRYIILKNGEFWMGTSEYRTREEAEQNLERRKRIVASLESEPNGASL